MLSEKNILKLEKRRKIYEFINKNPGFNIREISRKLNIPLTSLSHHLKYLKKLNLIGEKKEGKYKKIFVSDKISEMDKRLLGLLRNKNSCKILLYLFWLFSCSQIELSKELHLPPSTVSYYLKRMVDMGIIEETSAVNGKIYPFPEGGRFYIERNPIRSEKYYRRKSQEVVNSFYRLLIAHKSSLANESFIDDFLECIKPYTKDRKKYGLQYDKTKKIDDQIDNVAYLIYDYFRPPFCA